MPARSGSLVGDVAEPGQLSLSLGHPLSAGVPVLGGAQQVLGGSEGPRWRGHHPLLALHNGDFLVVDRSAPAGEINCVEYAIDHLQISIDLSNDSVKP